MMGRFSTRATGWGLGLALASSLAVGCGGGDDPDHTYQTGIEPTSGHEDGTGSGPGIDSTEATNIALELAGREGHDVQAYSDVVVHQNDGGDWVVQLRRPRMIRFLEVVVDESSGEAVLSTRSAGADG